MLLQLALAAAYWNRSLGLSIAGWFELYAVQMSQGLLPYRDFFLFTTPLFPATLAGWFKVADTSMAASFAFGALLRAVVTTAVYAWVRRLGGRPVPTLVAVTAVSMLAASDTGEPVNYYNHFCIAWVMGSAMLLQGSALRRPGWLLAAGALAALAVLAKQTIGTLWLLAAAGMVLVAPRDPAEASGPSARLQAGVFYALGVAMVLVPFGLWLAVNDLTGAFIDQVFVSGPSAKGPMHQTLGRPLEAWIYPEQRTGLGLAVLMVALVMVAARRLWLAEAPTSRWGWLALPVAALGVLGVARVGFGADVPFGGRAFHYGLMVAGVLCAAFGACWALVPRRSAGAGVSPRRRQAVLIWSVMSLAVYAALALSFSLYEPMAMPAALALFVVPMLVCAEGHGERAGAQYAAAGLLLLCLPMVTAFKAWHPFDWEGWAEPRIAESSVRFHDGPLKGLRLSPSTAQATQDVLQQIQVHSRAPDDVFCFPHLAAFYVLAGKLPPTQAAVHYADVAPDAVVEADLERLRRSPPRVLVMMPLTAEQVSRLEQRFRGGQPSAIGRMNSHLQSLRPGYREVLRRSFGPGRELVVWVRPS
ncbi:MAG: glycosyltransferase family 39 protein [Aquabacterium sp.]|nr:glycosyltransferase family 39 protein [Aquabacterium sp.]